MYIAIDGTELTWSSEILTRLFIVHELCNGSSRGWAAHLQCCFGYLVGTDLEVKCGGKPTDAMCSQISQK